LILKICFLLVTPLNVISRRPERFSPVDVAAFVRGIDPAFESLASRFLQEVIFVIFI
jgi:hypothetical protein